jgi:putative ABC transport system ATP-binding protein
MSIDDEYKILCRLELFENLDPVQLKRLIFISQRYQLQPNEYLFRQGDPMDRVFGIMQGEFSVLIESNNGDETQVAKQGPGDLVGEIGAISGEPRSASIRANSVCEVIGFEKGMFLDTVINHPATALKMMKLLSERLVTLNGKVVKLSGGNHVV